MKTPITYWGGKQTLAATILSLIPDHVAYCEPFFGGGAVFFAKPPSKVEIINDLNGEVVNFYRQAKENFADLQARVQYTLHSRQTWADALVIYKNPHLFSEVERAWAFWVVCNQGRSGIIGCWGFGTTCASYERKIKNGRQNFGDDLCERLSQVQIECSNALHLLKVRDRETTFFYLDPPYHNADMGHYGGYTEQDFERLLQHCAEMKGKFLLSSYPSDLLDQYTARQGWQQIKIEQRVLGSSKQKQKTEVFTANYPIQPSPQP